MRNLKVKTHLPNEILINGKTYQRDNELTALFALGKVSNFGLQAKESTDKKKIAVLPVLSRNLRGKRDLWGNYYTPTMHIFSYSN